MRITATVRTIALTLLVVAATACGADDPSPATGVPVPEPSGTTTGPDETTGSDGEEQPVDDGADGSEATGEAADAGGEVADEDERVDHDLDPILIIGAVEERSGKDLTYSSCVANMILSAVEHGELPEQDIVDWLAGDDPVDALPSTDSLRPPACPGA